MAEIIYKQESYNIISVCLNVYNTLGMGFLEAVYKDAIEHEFRKREIKYEREKSFDIKYKDVILSHKYRADFIVYDKIILEIKSKTMLPIASFRQTLNYLAVSKYKLGIIVNFGESSLKYKRVVLWTKFVKFVLYCDSHFVLRQFSFV